MVQILQELVRVLHGDFLRTGNSHLLGCVDPLDIDELLSSHLRDMMVGLINVSGSLADRVLVLLRFGCLIDATNDGKVLRSNVHFVKDG